MFVSPDANVAEIDIASVMHKTLPKQHSSCYII